MCPLVLGCEFLSVCVCICGIPVMFAAFNDIFCLALPSCAIMKRYS